VAFKIFVRGLEEGKDSPSEGTIYRDPELAVWFLYLEEVKEHIYRGRDTELVAKN